MPPRKSFEAPVGKIDRIVGKGKSRSGVANSANLAELPIAQAFRNWLLQNLRKLCAGFMGGVNSAKFAELTPPTWRGLCMAAALLGQYHSAKFAE